MAVEQQVAIIYASVNGLLDKVPVNRVKAFETNLAMVLTAQHQNVLDDFRAGKLTDESVATLKKVVADLSGQYA